MTKERLEEILKEKGINMTNFISLADYNAVVESMKKAVNEAIGECANKISVFDRTRILNLEIKD